MFCFSYALRVLVFDHFAHAGIQSEPSESALLDLLLLCLCRAVDVEVKDFRRDARVSSKAVMQDWDLVDVTDFPPQVAQEVAARFPSSLSLIFAIASASRAHTHEHDFMHTRAHTHA